MWLAEDDLEADAGAPLVIEQPNRIVTKPLSPDNQDDRIKSVLGLTSDDPLPECDAAMLRAYYQHLAAKLSFPFEAKYSFQPRPFESKTYAITVLSLLDPEEFAGEEYGLFCKARRENEQIELPLTEVEVAAGNPNRRLIGDYSHWFLNS
ncbi:MAG: hypothetical protein HY000_09500 [Planctomycetes bacterium]|nr:hypothetical protein [Planctomycetota bacterium]